MSGPEACLEPENQQAPSRVRCAYQALSYCLATTSVCIDELPTRALEPDERRMRSTACELIRRYHCGEPVETGSDVPPQVHCAFRTLSYCTAATAPIPTAAGSLSPGRELEEEERKMRVAACEVICLFMSGESLFRQPAAREDFE